MYSSNFSNLVLNSKENFYVGSGNPNSKILIVGKESAIGDKNDFEKQNRKNYLSNLSDWKLNIKKKIYSVDKNWNYDEYMTDINAKNNPLFSFKGVNIKDHREGQTFRKYQKLHDIIINGRIIDNKDRPYDFQNNFFLTEMSDNPFPTTRQAKEQDEFEIKLEKRKNCFFKSNFIQDFQVVVLACGDYIWNYGIKENRQILNIFGTDYVDCFETKETRKPQKFYIHKYNKADNRKPKIVIHTNQLSGSVASNELLIEMGNIIREFMIEENLIK